MGIPFLIVASTVGLIVGANAHVLWAGRGRRHTAVAQVPERRVGIVLGCAPRLPGGNPNMYFTARVRAAAALYHCGKVETLLVSGAATDSSETEASAMRDALVALGVPQSSVCCDNGGKRTWDSMRRARFEYAVRSAVLVTQAFHTSRSVYLALYTGIDAHAFHAQAPSCLSRVELRLQTREVFARVRALLDVSADGLR